MNLKHNLIAGYLFVLIFLLFSVPSKSACPLASGLATTSITASSAVLNWNAVAGSGGYKVRYKKSSVSNWTTISVSSNTATLSGLTSSTSYDWKVLTNCTQGNSGFGSPVSFTTLSSGCSVPSGLNVSSITTSSATFGWNAASGASGYNVQYRITGSSTWTSTSSASTSKAVSGLTANSSYEFQVQTVCTAGGNSSWSSSSTFSTLQQTCAVTTSTNSNSITTSGATLGWSSVSGASSFNVQYRITGTSTWTQTSAATNSKVISGLSPATTYEFQVQTVCSTGGTSAWSNSATFTTLQQTCTTPSGLNSSSISTSGATLGWNSISDASSYNVQYRVTGSSTWTSTTTSTNSKTITGLSSSTTYEFQVQTICTWGGTSSWSTSSTFTTSLQSCGVATNLNASSITTTGATLGWATVSGAASYNVQYRITGSSTWTSTTASANSKSVSGLASGTTYEFQVQTVCSGNSSSWSSSSVFTTQTPCTAPTGLNVSSITQSTATLNWNTGGGALSYSIQYRKTGTTTWSASSSGTTSKTLSGLSPATNYEFQVLTVCSSGNSPWSSSSNFTTANSTSLPIPDHIVILIEENHGYSQIIGSASAPYMNALANDAMSMLFTQAYGIEHPSQPNYIDLFSGGNQGVTNNNVPSAHFTTPNLARELINAGKTFISYSQSLPGVGYDGASSGKYMRKHNPITNWMGTGTNQVSASLNQPFSSFPSDFTTLPTVSFVIPDQDYDMHDGTIATADTWFHNNLDAYVQWAKTHNSLFIMIWDEDDGNYSNRIPMIFTGPMVKPGTLSTTYNHYNVLRTIEDMYGTTHAGNAASAASIHGCWLNGFRQSADIKLEGSGFRWEVFPNPASTTINITYEMEDESNPNLTVYNNLGEKLTDLFLPETGSGSHQVSFSTETLGMNKGIYFLEMRAGNKKYLKKIAVLQ
jgi:hypothetical protein